MKNIIEMTNIKKSFGTNQAIKEGNFNLREGEIHSIIGENGAGKSTLMKLLYGMYSPDQGEIIVRGNNVHGLNTKQAISLGIGMVHQEFMLVEEMTVLENIILGNEPRKSFSRIDFTKAKKELEAYLTEYDFEIRLNKKVADIPVGEAQRAEIIKTLYRGSNIIILDEPTAVLTPQESRKLFEIIRKLKESGTSIVFISHKLKEVLEISDRITVMRNGKHVDTIGVEDANEKKLTNMMIGKDVYLNIPRNKAKSKKVVFTAKDMYIPGEREISKIRNMSFDVYEGEILGIAGISGNGQQELAEALIGTRVIEKGSLYFNGEDITHTATNNRRKKGISCIPEDRNTEGLIKDYSIGDNLIPLMIQNKEITNSIGVINSKHKVKATKELIERFDVRPPIGEVLCKNLSGGNAQKVIIAREIGMNPKMLIAAQPTRGVDIGSIEYIRTSLQKLKEQGTAIIMISADLDEIFSLSDRIMVIYEGQIMDIVDVEKATYENIGLMMMGGKVDETIGKPEI